MAVLCNKRRLGLGILSMGLLSFILLAAIPLGDAFLSPLEHRFPARPQAMNPTYSVVLGGAEENEQAAATGMVNVNDAGERLLAAIELAIIYPDAKLILSGGSGRMNAAIPSSAALKAETLSAAGIASDRLLLEHQSRNTAENGRQSAELVGEGVSAPTSWLQAPFTWRAVSVLFVARAGPTSYPIRSTIAPAGSAAASAGVLPQTLKT